jgi:GTP-binding nuclear protein Ran
MGTLRDEYELSFDCAAIVFDVSRRSTRKNVPTWHREIKTVCGDATPVVLCGNKADKMQLNHRMAVVTTTATFLNKERLRYCELSAESGGAVQV